MASKISIPAGMDAALEGLARAVLKEQPENIYVFAVHHFERLVRMRNSANLKTHNAGLSPSSTQDSNSKPPVSDEDAKPISEEKSVTEEPESNDTSHGVEATAVRTLAATTGTVAILGTTAKTNDKKKNDSDDEDNENETPTTSTPPIASDIIPEGNEKEEEDTVAVVHDTTSKTKDEVSRNEDEEIKKTVSPLDTRPTSSVKTEHILLEEVKDNTQSTINKTDDISVVDNKPSPVDDVVKHEPTDNVPSTVETEKSKPEEDISVTNEENVNAERDTTPEKEEVESDKDVTSEVSNIESKPKEDEVTKTEETEDDKASEISKGNEEDNSKSISSERLKTNSISDTTLSESFNAELENNSIKQSPSAEKAVESFDSSSTIEFVDLENKENVRQKRDVSDLAEGNQPHVGNLESEAPSYTLPSEVKQNVFDRSENITEVTEEPLVEVKPTDKEVSTSVVGTEVQTAAPVTDDRSESVIKPDLVSDESKEVESGPKVDEVVSNTVLSIPEELKAGEQNTVVNKTDIDGEVVDETVNAAATTIQATFRGFQTRKQLKDEKDYETREKVEEEIGPNEANTIVTTVEKIITDSEKYDDRSSKEEVQDLSEDNKLDSAATTIQATFRGFQTRKQLKEEVEDASEPDFEDKEKIFVSQIKEKLITETSNDDADAIKITDQSRNDKADGEGQEDDKISSAATTIQATFRGFQTRKQLKDDAKDESKDDEIKAVSEQITEVQKEVQHDINQEEEKTIETEDNKADTAATTIQATFRGFQTRKQLKHEPENEPTATVVENENVTEAIKEEEIENITEAIKEKIENIGYAVDEKISSAATTIQATFRGFQTRKQLKEEKEESEDNTDGVNSLTETVSAKTDSVVNVEDETKAKVIVEPEAPEKTVDVATANDVANSAATTIQSTFRGFQTRKQLKEEDESQVKPEEKDNKSEAGDSKTDFTEEVPEQIIDSTEEQNVTEIDKTSSAATTIQATFRGFQTRKQLKEEDESQVKPEEKDNKSEAGDRKTDFTEEVPEQIIDSTEEQNVTETDKTSSAATTIQATFRGYQTRKQLKDEKESETPSVAEVISEPTPDAKEEKQPKDVTISEETKETVIEAVDDITDSAATTIQAAFRGFQIRQQLKNEDAQETVNKDLPVENDVSAEHAVSLEANNASSVTEDLAATKIQATFRGFQVRQQMKNENDENLDNKLEQSPTEHSPSELSKASEDDSEQVKRQSEGDKDSLSEEIRQSLSKLEDTIQREENKLNMVNESLPEQIGESSDEGYEQPDASRDGSFDRGTRTPTALTPEQIDIVKEEVDEICKQAVATTESILAEKNGLGEHQKDDAVSKEETVHKEIHAETSSDSKHNNEEDIFVVLSEDTAHKEPVRAETLVVIEDADAKLVSAATTIQASFRGYQTRQRLAETEQSEQPDSLPDFPPPALDDEYLFGPSVADEDLPPPDFEALESSYSEDAPTEPLAPPPPLDQDTEKFIEEEEEEDIDEEELKSLQRPPECDELPENRLTIDKNTSGETESTVDTNTSTDAESSLSSAATKIQAGVRGYLTRKQIHGDTTSTSGPSIVDSDQSLGNLSTSREEEGPVRSNISMEEESEICRHKISPDVSVELKQTNADQPRRPTDKRMSLGSNIIDRSTAKKKPLRTAMSMQIGASRVSDDEVWDVLKTEMSEAATVIQSNYRGYRARKQLQREDAVQVLTSSSSVATNGVSSIDRDMEASTRNSGELHDIIALTPPNIEQTSSVAAEGGTGDLTASTAPARNSTPPSDEMVKRRAEADQDQHQSATKRTAHDHVLKDANIAAAKIQAGFRGYKVRKQLRNRDSGGSVNGPKRSGTNNRLEGRQPKSPTMTLEDKSAAKIQAGVRGFLVRRRQQIEKDAATKIQAGFRGFKARRQVKEMKTDK